jgi:hypothetical protein
MSSTTATRRASNATAAASAMPGGVVTTTRRRAPMRIIAGLLAVALGFVVGAVVLSSLNKAVDVLSVARAVSAGSVLTDADLTTVSIVPADSLHVVIAARRAEVIGQTAAVPLAVGSLLTAEQLGAVTDPGAGQSILAVGVKTGRAPAGLAPGASVVVLVVPSSSGAQTTPVQAPAVVRNVEVPDTSGLTVVTVQMSSEAALRVASAPGDVTIVVRGR